MRKLLVVAFGILALAAPAAAQDDKKVEFNVGFGTTIPVSGFKDSFDTGWNGAFGVTFNLTPMLGVQAEYGYHRMDGPSKTITVFPTPVAGVGQSALLESNQQIHSGTFNIVAHSPHRSSSIVGGYGLGGLGIYHRTVQITTPTVGYTTFCDPYWYVCYPALVSVDTIIGDRSSNDFGINFGGGITFGHSAKFYVEARYHYVWGPEIKPPAGLTTTQDLSSNAQYFPITFGVRW